MQCTHVCSSRFVSVSSEYLYVLTTASGLSAGMCAGPCVQERCSCRLSC
jgi:hypothetical protein